MSSNADLPDEFDPATLRWPPRCIYCGGPRQTEISTKIPTQNKKPATIRIPYCTRHSREATRNRRIINATLLGGLVAGLLVSIGGLANLAFLWRSDVHFPLIDYVESVVGTVVLAAIVAILAPALALRALSRFMPSLEHSQNANGLLGLGMGRTRLTLVNDGIAADFRRLNPEISSPEHGLPPVPRSVKDRHSPDKPGAFPIAPLLLGGAAIALLVLLVVFLIVIFALQPR